MDLTRLSLRRWPKAIFLLPVFSALFSVTPSRAQVSVTATAGTAGPTSYTTLKGAFDAINAGTHQSVVTVIITGNTTETASAVLNASGSGGALYTSIMVKPDANANPVVTGSIATNAIIKLNGASNVTIDGSNNGTASRNLTISNTNASGKVVWMGSTGSTAITGDSLKNCTLIGGNVANANCFAVALGAASSPTSYGLFSNLTIRNNSIQKAKIGINLLATTTGTNGSGLLITGNDLNSTGTNAIGNYGIYAEGVNGATIHGNNIGNFETVTNEDDYGIDLNYDCKNTNITQNTISNLAYTGTSFWSPVGIVVESDLPVCNNTISENTITNITSSGSWDTRGILIQYETGGLTITRNKISNIKNTNSTAYGATGILSESYAFGTGSAIGIANNFVWDVAARGVNGFTPSDNGNGIAINEDGPVYNIYHNTVWMNTNQIATAANRGAAMLITDYVYTANCINMRNNLFINTQTVGNANSRFALVVTAANNVFATNNYNDYYSASGNLLCRGSNTTIYTTIAQVQTNLGQNGNSISFNPSFISATDPHLVQTAVNNAVNNTGVTIAAITNDIDGEVRASPPDIGADEFLNCPAITFTQPANAAVCAGQTASFTATATNVTAYQWQVNTGTGWTALTNTGPYSGATTTTLTITGATATLNGYQYRAYATSACGSDTSAIRTLAVNAPPAAPTLSSNSPVCVDSTINLMAATVAGGSYAWTGPGSYTATGQNPSRANATTAMSGTYNATVAVAGCTSAVSSITVIVNPTPQIATATGNNPSVCNAADGSIALTGLAATTTYSVTYLKNGNPVGPVALTSGVGGDLTIPGLTSGAYSGIAVASLNCPSPATTTTINLVDPSAPAQPSAVNGQTTGCIGIAQTYSVTPVAGLTYTWTVPAGWTGNGSNTATFIATAGPAAQAGNITVVANNTCGSSIVRTLAVTVSSTPAQPGLISGAANTCAGVSQTYSILPVPGAATYTWSLPANWPGSSATTSIVTAPTATGGVITVTATNICGTSAPSTKTVVSNPVITPSVTITTSTPTTTICAGTPVTFTAIPVNGGSAPTYQWLRNGISTGTYTPVYTNSTLASGDVISVTMTSSAACPSPSATATSSVAMTVQPITVTGININAAFGTPPVVCPGTPVSFTANTTGGGTSPVYQWMVNNTPVGTNAPTYSTSTLASGDLVSCVLTSSASCPSPAVVESNTVSLQVSSIIVPQLSIVATPDTNMAGGQPVTFTAIVNGQGPTPGYQWFKNGSPIGGAIGSAYTTSSWVTGDQFYLRLVSSAPCAAPNVLTSNRLRMHATTSVGAVAGSAGISLWPNPNAGRFTLVLSNAAGNVRTRVEILNALGQVVYFREVIVDRKDWSTDIELGAGIADGIYLLRLTGEDGSRSTDRFEVRR